MTQSTLARPDTSRRRNRSPNTVISNQNHSTKIKIEKTSVRKLGKVKPPGNNMSVLPFRWNASPAERWTFCRRGQAQLWYKIQVGLGSQLPRTIGVHRNFMD